MRAWWVYWISIVIAAAAWIATPLILGRNGFRELMARPAWLVALVGPLVVAGVDLVAYRASHEEVCRLEAQRHSWIRRLVGDGYSARTFAWTGIALLLAAGLVVASAASLVR
jgi:hypothetical protein